MISHRFRLQNALVCKTHHFATQNAPFWKSGVALALCNKCVSKEKGESICLIIKHLRWLPLGGFRQIQRCSCPCVSSHEFRHVCHPLHVQTPPSRLRNAPSNTLLPLFFLPTFPILVEQNITYWKTMDCGLLLNYLKIILKNVWGKVGKSGEFIVTLTPNIYKSV